jgi:hypothetical protein
MSRRAWLAKVLAAERGGAVDDHRGAWKAIFDPRVLLLAGLYIGMPLGAYGLSYWLPTIVKSFGVSNSVNGLINVIPWLWSPWPCGSCRATPPSHGASAWHIAGPCLLGALALTLSVIVPGAALKFAMLCIAAPAIFAAQPVFWSLPPSFLSGPRAAAGIAAINAIGNLGGFIAQNLVPMVRDATGSNLAPMLALAAVLVVTSGLIFVPWPGWTGRGRGAVEPSSRCRGRGERRPRQGDILGAIHVSGVWVDRSIAMDLHGNDRRLTSVICTAGEHRLNGS